MSKQIIENGMTSSKDTEGNSWLVLFILAVIYILSPIDFIPDFIPIIGLLDDIGIGGGLLGASFKQLLNVANEKN